MTIPRRALTCLHGRTAWAIVFLLFPITPCFGASPVISFESAFESYSLPANPSSIASGDFDLDGLTDLVAVGASYSQYHQPQYGFLSVLHGGPAARFGERSDLTLGRQLTEVVAGDFDGDGRMDAAALDLPSTLQIFWNDGAGGLRPAAPILLQGYAVSLTAADANRDGRIDLAVGEHQGYPNPQLDYISIYSSREDSTFQTLSIVPTVGRAYARFADLNADGLPDLVASCSLDGVVSTFIGDGQGHFEHKDDADVTYRPQHVAIADFNGDGRMDIAVGNPDLGDVSLLLGLGDGTVEPRRDSARGIANTGLIAADLNADGRPELIGALFSQASGITTTTVSVDGGFGQTDHFLSGPASNGLLAGDFDHNGDMDVACIQGRSRTIAIHIGDGSGHFGTPTRYAAGGPATDVSLTDIDEDGRTDAIASVGSRNVVSIFHGLGDGRLGEATSLVTGEWPTHVAVGDVDLDGHSDIATVYQGDYLQGAGLSLFKGLGGGAFSPPVNRSVDPGPWWVAIGDATADGLPDLVTAHGDLSGICFSAVPRPTAHIAGSDSKISVFATGPGGEPGPPITLDAGFALPAVAIVDVNQDSRADIVAGNWRQDGKSGSVFVFISKGGGDFQPALEVAQGVAPEALAVADLNSDGWIDIITANASLCGFEGSASVILARGDGTYFQPVEYPIPGSAFGVSVGDLSGDGIPDLALASEASNSVSVLINDGTGKFGERSDFGCGGGPFAVAIGDLDFDGRNDLVCANAYTQDISVLLNQTGSPSITRARAFAEPDSRSIPVGEHGPDLCIRVELPSESGVPADIDIPSIRLSLPAASVEPAIPYKWRPVADSDHNGVPEMGFCFKGHDVFELLAHFTGKREVHALVTGRLIDGRGLRADLEFQAVGIGRRLSATVSPNPLNPAGVLSFEMDRPGPALVRIFSVTGRLVRVMLDADNVPAGQHTIRIDGLGGHGESLATGIYFYSVEAAGAKVRGRFAVLK